MSESLIECEWCCHIYPADHFVGTPATTWKCQECYEAEAVE